MELEEIVLPAGRHMHEGYFCSEIVLLLLLLIPAWQCGLQLRRPINSTHYSYSHTG